MEMNDMIARYRKNYIKEIRKDIGHAPLMITACGIIIENDKGEMELFGIYSGEDRILVYPNSDICCVTSIIFRTRVYNGEIQNNTDEAIEHRFFDKTCLPDNINDFDKRYISDWAENPQHVIID